MNLLPATTISIVVGDVEDEERGLGMTTTDLRHDMADVVRLVELCRRAR